MTTLLEQARKLNQELDFPYYIQPQNGKFVARCDYYKETTFFSGFHWPAPKEKFEAKDSDFPAFNTETEARDYIVADLLQMDKDNEKYQIRFNADIC